MNSHPSILILGDNPDRISRFTAAIQTLSPPLTLHIWRTAHEMIRHLPAHLPNARLISLDHDLDPIPNDPTDPGDGLDLARSLAPLRPPCPILIHSSNADRVTRMLGEFQLTHCNAHTILPFGHDWIESYWLPTVQKLLASPQH